VQSLKFLAKVVNKTAASTAQFSKVHFASCLFTYKLQQQKLHIPYLTSWHNSIFGYKLRTIEAENR